MNVSPQSSAPPRSMRTLMPCADDFGVSAGVSRAIARLAGAQRLNATSCITSSVHWPAQAPRLRDLPRSVQVGLHFNLTEGLPLCRELARLWPRFPALPRLILMAHLGLLPRAALAAEFEAQHAAFVAATGHEPDHVDGHQHVHHLPGVRALLWRALPASTAVRNTGTVIGPGFAVKRALIECTGGRALQAALQRRGIAHNPVLTGCYDFRSTDYRGLMQGWLAHLPAAGGLLFCHPGDAGEGDADPIAEARAREAAYLGSEAFVHDLAQAGVVLGPLWQRCPDGSVTGRSTDGSS